MGKDRFDVKDLDQILERAILMKTFVLGETTKNPGAQDTKDLFKIHVRLSNIVKGIGAAITYQLHSPDEDECMVYYKKTNMDLDLIYSELKEKVEDSHLLRYVVSS